MHDETPTLCFFPVFLSSLVCAVALLWPLPTRADIALSIEPAGADLGHLAIGQTATIEVRLSGLAPGGELDTVAATLTYDASRLGEPRIVPGPIVPDPLDDPLDFLTAEKAGYVEGTFLTFGKTSADRIRANGLFFSFDVTALAPGQGAFRFDFVDATAPNPDDPFDPLPVTVQTNGPVSFTVVPEPSSVFLLAIMGAAIGAGGVRARRRRMVKTRSERVT